MADERDLVPAPRVAARLGVNLRDERADGVDDLEPALRALLVDLLARRRARRGRRARPRARPPRTRRRSPLAPRDRARRARCGRSRGGRRPAGRGVSSSFSTMSIARTTPAQKLRGLATRTRLLTWPAPEASAAARSSAASARRAPRRRARRASAARSRRPARRRPSRYAPSGPRRVGEPADRLLGGVGDRPDDAGEAAASRRASRSRCRRRPRRSARELARARRRRRRRRPAAQTTAVRAPGTRSGSPSQSTVPSASTTRVAVTSVPGLRARHERARKAEATRGGPSGSGQARLEPDPGGAAPAAVGRRPPRPRARRRA